MIELLLVDGMAIFYLWVLLIAWFVLIFGAFLGIGS